MRSRHGFTLIELLVVISIIALLTALPMDMPGDSARLVVNQSPGHAIDGQRFKIDLSVRLGDQDMKSARLRGTLVHAHNGQTLELAACSLGGSLRTERQVELDLRGVPAGQWRLRLWLEGTEVSGRDAPQITLQVLPSPFAADATTAEPLNTP